LAAWLVAILLTVHGVTLLCDLASVSALAHSDSRPVASSPSQCERDGLTLPLVRRGVSAWYA
jgi:hypothetical protein